MGVVWLCSKCDQIHLTYGNITMTLCKEQVEEILAFSPCPEKLLDIEPLELLNIHMKKSGQIQWICGDATLEFDRCVFENFLYALYRLHSEQTGHQTVEKTDWLLHHN